VLLFLSFLLLVLHIYRIEQCYCCYYYYYNFYYHSMIIGLEVVFSDWYIQEEFVTGWKAIKHNIRLDVLRLKKKIIYRKTIENMMHCWWDKKCSSIFFCLLIFDLVNWQLIHSNKTCTKNISCLFVFTTIDNIYMTFN